MQRRTFIHGSLIASVAAPFAGSFAAPLLAAVRGERFDAAAEHLERSVSTGQTEAAVLHVRHGDTIYNRALGKARDENAMFLLGSISKPINVTALMRLYDRGQFKLDDPVKKYLPRFTGDGRDQATVRHLLSHVSGLPDQLPDNDRLRREHAPLSEFVAGAMKTPLHFAPGTKYQYSSMAILLATHIAELLSGSDILTLVDETVLQPLKMKHSAQGLGRFQLADMVRMQTEFAAPEAGGGDPSTKSWDWNSPYWRKLGVPWGGTHCSAPDVGRWLAEFLFEQGAVVKPETARQMVANQNPPGFTPRGLGFGLGAALEPAASEKTFGHTGSTGTIAWADPATKTICVVLTSLPARAVQPHPRTPTSAAVAALTKE